MSETKLFEELLCLDIFQEEGGGCLIPKMMRYFFLLWLRHFPMKMGEDDQNLNILKNFSSSKIWFFNQFLKGFQKYRARRKLFSPMAFHTLLIFFAKAKVTPGLSKKFGSF